MGQDKPPQYSDASSTTHYVPQFSHRQKSFLGVVDQFASVKPLGLRIFLNLVQEDDELFSKEFPNTSKEVIEAVLDNILIDSTFKPFVSGHLAQQDYSAALISISTIMAVSLLSVQPQDRQDPPNRATADTHLPPTNEETNPGGENSTLDLPADQPSGQYAPKFSAEQESFLDVAHRIATVKSLSVKVFLNLLSEDEDLLSREFPDLPMENIVAEIDGIPFNITFREILSALMNNQDYSMVLIAIMTLVAISTSNSGPGASNRNAPPRSQGMPLSYRPRFAPAVVRNTGFNTFSPITSLEGLDDAYSAGLNHLYDLLWNRQENITFSHTTMVPNLPCGHVNFGQLADTATLPPSFGQRPTSYGYNTLCLPDDSEAILPANNRSLKQILIQPRYIDIYNELDLDGHHAIIVGQPGSGKSCLLAYILTERLRKRQQTLLQLDEDDVYLFNENGATKYPAKCYLGDTVLQDAWFLVDCNEHGQGIPEISASAYRVPSLKVIRAVSPQNDYGQWGKRLSAKHYWLFSPSLEESYVLCCKGIVTLTMNDSKWAFLYLKYGSNPRICSAGASSSAHDILQSRYVEEELASLKKAGSLDHAVHLPIACAILPPLDSVSLYTAFYSSQYAAQQLYYQGYGSSELVSFNQVWENIRPIRSMFDIWGLHRLAIEREKSWVVKAHLAPESTCNYYHGYIATFSDLNGLKTTLQNDSQSWVNMLFLPGVCAFPVDALVRQPGQHICWLVLVTSGMDRIVDGKALEGLPQMQHCDTLLEWRFLLIVPEECNTVDSIQVEIQGDESTVQKFRNIPRYVLRL